MGDKNLYSKLREFGFDTFEDLFPNVGKDEDNYEKRCDNLLVDLYNLCTMSLDDVDKLYKSILPRLEKNRNTVLTLMMANKKWIEDLKKIMKIGFIGFGKLGQPCGEVIAQKGHDVVAYDVNQIDTHVEMRAHDTGNCAGQGYCICRGAYSA